jgi:hypothetical protein
MSSLSDAGGVGGTDAGGVGGKPALGGRGVQGVGASCGNDVPVVLPGVEKQLGDTGGRVPASSCKPGVAGAGDGVATGGGSSSSGGGGAGNGCANTGIGSEGVGGSGVGSAPNKRWTRCRLRKGATSEVASRGGNDPDISTPERACLRS